MLTESRAEEIMRTGRLILLAALVASPAQAFDAASYYQATCATCHGPNGAGDGVVAKGLPVKPADFTDPVFWSTRDDARVAKSIKEGGAAVGVSPLMAPFGATLSDSELTSVVAYLRTFEKKEARAPTGPVSVPSPRAEPVQAVVAESASTVAPELPVTVVDEPEPATDPSVPEELEPTVEPDAAVDAEPWVAVRLARPEADLDDGAKLYRTRCAVCHGKAGGGDGPAARGMDPAPRDFTTGVYKFTSTPMGEPAASEDIYRIVSHGMRGTAMPGWRGLESADRWQLVYYLESLSERFDNGDGEPFQVPAPPMLTPDLVATGAAVYTSSGCGACHGADGRGDGPSATGMVDSFGNDLLPSDLTRGWRFKGGNSSESIYRTVVAGIDGTPMPSFAHLSEEERWAMVYWIRAQFADADDTLR